MASAQAGGLPFVDLDHAQSGMRVVDAGYVQAASGQASVLRDEIRPLWSGRVIHQAFSIFGNNEPVGHERHDGAGNNDHASCRQAGSSRDRQSNAAAATLG